MAVKKKAKKKPSKVVIHSYDGAECHLTGDRIEELDGHGDSYHYALRKDIVAALKKGSGEVTVYGSRSDQEENVYDLAEEYFIEIGCKRFENEDAFAIREWAMGKK